MDSDEYVDDFVRILVLHKEVGFHSAWDNWHSCSDPDSLLDRTSSEKRRLARMKATIASLKERLSRKLSETDFKTLSAECSDQLTSTLEETERKIEIEYRPSDVYFNKDALIDMTDVSVPEDIQICLSFGYKFMSPYICSDKNMHSILAQLDKCIDDSVPDLQILETSIEIYHILLNRSSVQADNNKNWLAFIAYRTKTFFESNSNIFATKSDKGGHTVIISVADYELKLNAHVNEGDYSLIEHDPLHTLVEEEKEILKQLRDIRELKEEFKQFGRKSGVWFEPNTLHLPKFYGLPKIHKPGTPLRPITSTVGSAGYYLAKFFDRLLNSIFPRTEFHIRDTYEFVKSVEEIFLGDDDVLVSFDVVSMFSTIPYELVFDIIMSKARNFQDNFSINENLLMRIISFVLKDCMVFTALDNIYRQDGGIPMGSCLSPTVARLVMDRVVLHLLARVPQITFIKVFVDDTSVAIHKDRVDLALDTLNNFRPGQIRFTLERENDFASINFLNVTLTREKLIDVFYGISTNWFRKSFASGRLLNYYSSHKRTTVMATAAHFIRTVLILSDSTHFQSNKPIVFKTLRENSFPETTIISLMNTYYTLMKSFPKRSAAFDHEKSHSSQDHLLPTQLQKLIAEKEDEKEGYKIFPHSICEGRRLKRILTKFKSPGVILADSVRNTRISAITTRKTIIPVKKRKNLILVLKCVCKAKYKVARTNFNETGEMAQRRSLTINKLECDQFGHAYRHAKFLPGLCYGSQTRYLHKYVSYMYRHAFDGANCPYEHPNDRLRKLIKCSCCKHTRHPQRKGFR